MPARRDERLEILLDVPIRFDTADGTVIHSPMIEATVGGLATRLILDTGSTDHVLTRELVDRARASVMPAEDGTDHAGAPVGSWSVGALDVEIAMHAFALRDVVAIAAPGPFEGWGVGGFPAHSTWPGMRAASWTWSASGSSSLDPAGATRRPSMRP